VSSTGTQPFQSAHSVCRGGGGLCRVTLLNSSTHIFRAYAPQIILILLQGARGLVLRHGDVICVGPGPEAPRFRVEALPSELPPQAATAAMVQDALRRCDGCCLCLRYGVTQFFYLFNLD
jgi:hypothetical protein